ncbi:acylphosphatase [Chromohalobacter beijerinckii]|uniref:acylphosphatase n=1 Tax=Chromohalobacter beijerinckii TaxID=86179 RepID=A0ABV8XAB4_9GAMM|nr:acylphosphatase [Chromohalobacter beijerinckii]MCK0766081.1 acylphosphatase [Chromohalobacter beijerinckii]
MHEYCLKAWVTGRVQGVGFRAASRDQALMEGLTGHARNLGDGRVEVLLCGERAAVDRVVRWLWQGPPASRVTHVECEEVDVTHPSVFELG